MADSAGPGSRGRRFWDFLGFIGWLFALPAALLVCGLPKASTLFQASFGPFGAPSSLLLVFLVLTLLGMLFGSAGRAFPVLVGLVLSLACFATVFDFPGLGFVRAAVARFPAFSEPGPAFFSGLLAIALGSILGHSTTGKSLKRAGLIFLATLACLIALAWAKPFPKLEAGALSIEGALAGISKTLGYEYRNPEVEKALKVVVEDRDKTVAEKEKLIAELTARVQKAGEDEASLRAAAEDAKRLAGELEAAKAALATLKGKLDKDQPQLKGGSYAEAVQPFDPNVRDFAVKAASSSPGAFDRPQGSFSPTVEGIRQAALVHAAVSGSWKYVSDPGVDWGDYVSPAKRSLALGLAGDCDDFAVMVASCEEAIGGKARIVHGYTSKEGHAWAELWLGDSRNAALVLNALSTMSGRPVSSIAVDGAERDWLVLDWRLGEYSMSGARTEVRWTGGK